MTLLDLVFLASLLTAAATVVAALVALARGRLTRAGLLVRRIAVGAAIYFAVLLLVSAVTPQRHLRPGDRECSDDWCISVQTVAHQRRGAVMLYDVTFQLTSRARGVAQRERFVTAYLLDERGDRHYPVADPHAVPFDTLLRPGESIAAVRQFRLPASAHAMGVVVSREGAGRIPGCCIIGDESSLLHRRTIIALD